MDWTDWPSDYFWRDHVVGLAARLHPFGMARREITARVPALCDAYRLLPQEKAPAVTPGRVGIDLE